MKSNPENPFNGKFILPGFDTSQDGKTWITKHHYEHNDGLHDWEFEQKCVLDMPSGDVAYGGTFSIRLSDYPLKKCAFLYNDTSKMLYITSVETQGDLNEQINIYKVEQINERELWLYPVGEATTGSRKFVFRMKLKCID